VPTDAISGTKVEDMRETLRRYHGDKRTSQELDDKYYNQEVEAIARDHLPDDIPIYQSSLSTDVVDQVSDQLRTDEPNVDYGALTDSDREIARKSKFESWGKQVILDDQLGQDVDAYSQAGKDLSLRGEAVIKRLHNTNLPDEPVLSDFSGRGKRETFKEAHNKWEAEIAATSPLSPARAVDPLNCFIPPNAVNPLPYIIEHQERRQVDIWEDYPDWRTAIAAKVWAKNGKDTRLTDDELNDPLREVDWLEYYSKDQYILLIDGIEVVSTKNPYGFVPYSHVHSGLGRVDRRASSSAKAASILSKIRGELLSEIVLKTIMYELAQSYVFPRIRVPDGREDIVREGMRHRGILRYDPQDPQGANSIQWLDPIAINPAVSQFLGEAQAAIARRVNPILGGQGDAEFGVLEALRIGQAVKGIQEITTNLNRMATESVRQAAKMMIALDKSMTVYGTSDNGGRDYTMKSVDFKSYKQLEVRFEAVDPVEQTRKQQAGMVLFRGGAISRRTLQTEYLNDIVNNPVQEDTRMGVEAAEAAFYGSPEFLQWAVSKYQAIQQNESAEQQQQAVRSNSVAAGQSGELSAAGAGAGRTAEVETLSNGGATASTRDGAAQIARQAT
jgi:hypothetical protein|tara:strand:- start:1563 stop:3407 length:1845 start_codon:yes stop_codon:yes gene_type:complete